MFCWPILSTTCHFIQRFNAARQAIVRVRAKVRLSLVLGLRLGLGNEKIEARKKVLPQRLQKVHFMAPSWDRSRNNWKMG